MRTKKVSLTLEEELLSEAREVVGARPQRLILDFGAVIALARGDHRAGAFLAQALELGVPVEIPVVAWSRRSAAAPRDAPVHRVLKAAGSIPEAREVHGHTAGRLLGTARSSGTVDALVVAYAVVSGGAYVLTGDREGLEPLRTQ